MERPREKLERYGSGKLSNEELLAIILRTGTRGANAVQLGRKLLKKFGEDLSEISPSELQKIPGLGVSKACQIVACFELGRRFLLGKPGGLLISPEVVWERLAEIRTSKKEQLVVFYLDSQNREIEREVVSVGILNANLVHPREVFEGAVRNNAAQIILAHNHPSGVADPSEEDLLITRQLVEAGKILGIEVVDHIIVTKEEYFSFRVGGLL